MLGLMQSAARPTLNLEETVKNWFHISCLLRESPRKRRLQIEELDRPTLSLS
jgi:hypothetical protein